MGKRLLFILLTFVFTVSIPFVLLGSLFNWMITGEDLNWVLEWMAKELKELL